MNDTKIQTSIDDITELRKMILENPDLPLVIFAGEEAYNEEYPYSLTTVNSVEVKELTVDNECCIEKGDYRDVLLDKLAERYDTADELNNAVENAIQNAEFVKAIVVYVG